jgi:hypothetical protein
MTEKKSNAVPGCLSFIVLLFIMSACIVPVFRVAGSLSAGSDFAIKTVGSFLCPADTTPRGAEYQGTRRGSNGQFLPSTQISLQCVNKQGGVEFSDPVVYSLVWMGGFMLIGLVIALFASIIFAVPGGKLASALLQKVRGTKDNP